MDLDTTKESLELDCATLLKLNDQIILIRYRDGVDLDLDDAVAVSDGCIKLMNQRKFLALVDIRNIRGTLNKKAGDHFAQNKKFTEHLMAQAIVVNSLAIMLVASFFIKFNKPISESRIFKNIEKALDWLETQKHLLD